MKRWVLIFSLVTVFLMLDAANTKLDSLLANAKSLSGIDQARELARLSNMMWDKDASQGIELGLQALKIAEELEDIHISAAALRSIGTNYWAQGRYSKAEEYIQRAIKTIAESDPALLEAPNIKMELAACYGNLALVYDNQGKSDEALEYQLKSHLLNEQLDNKIGIISSSNNLGKLYAREQEYDKALMYFQQTYDVQMEIGNDERIPYTLNNLGVIYKNLNMFDKAKEHFAQSLEMERERNNPWGIATALYNMADIAYNDGDMGQAIRNIREALELRKKMGNYQQILETTVRLAYYLNQKGSIYEAESLLRDALMKTNELELPYERMSVLFTLSENAVLRKDYQEGYQLLSLFNALQDSIRTEERLQQFDQLRAQYELDIAEQDNELLRTTNQLNELEIQKKNTTIVFSLIGLGIVLLLILVILMNYQQKVRANTMLKQRNALIIQQKDALTQANEQLRELNNTKDRFFSIMAHDIKNPLVAQLSGAKILLSRIDGMDTDGMKMIAGEIQKNTFHLLGLLNNLLQWSRLQMKRIKCQPTPLVIAAIVHRSFELYGLKARNKEIELKHEIDPELLILADRDMLITVMNNLVSNAIKFSHPGAIVRVSTIQQENTITVMVQDSGIGMTPEQQENLFRLDVSSSTPGTNNEKGTGLGLILIKELVQQNDGEVRIQSEEGKGTTVSITLPAFHETKDT
jgi:signal transduction histidine kinase/tetratricopeptide (TPR) repeat protein